MENQPNFSQPIQQPSPAPITLPKKKKSKKPLLVFIIFLGILIIGIIVLRFTAENILTEVIQEVPQTSPIPNTAESLASSSFGESFLDKTPVHFELEDLDRKKVKFSDFLGKPTIITFWATWNTASVDQLRIINDVRTSDIFNILSINSQEERSYVNNFIERGGYHIPVLLDEKGSVTDQWQARVLPMTFFIDSEGVIREIYIGILSGDELMEKVEPLLK